MSIDPCLIEALQTLAEKLGTSFEYLMVLGRQRVAAEIFGLCISVLVTLVALVFSVMATSYFWRNRQPDDLFPDYIHGVMGGVLSSVVLLVLLTKLIILCVSREYHAIEYVFELLKGVL